jgi:hypothetical protein
MNRSLMLCAAALALAGCQSMPFSPLVSPRVTGRVLDADTRQPLRGVAIKSGTEANRSNSAMPPRGGELMIAAAPIYTRGDGSFALRTQRVLTPFRSSGWFSVRLLFERTGYEPFRTNCSSLNLGTNTPANDSVLSMGDIVLHPARK